VPIYVTKHNIVREFGTVVAGNLECKRR